VRDVLTKSIGTQNPINLVKATMDGLVRLRRPEEVAELRGLTITQVLGLDGGNGAAGPVSDSGLSLPGESSESSPPAADAAPADAEAPAAEVEKPADEVTEPAAEPEAEKAGEGS
jgi:small subunit ribosomal protein S5